MYTLEGWHRNKRSFALMATPRVSDKAFQGREKTYKLDDKFIKKMRHLWPHQKRVPEAFFSSAINSPVSNNSFSEQCKRKWKAKTGWSWNELLTHTISFSICFLSASPQLLLVLRVKAIFMGHLTHNFCVCVFRITKIPRRAGG